MYRSSILSAWFHGLSSSSALSPEEARLRAHDSSRMTLHYLIEMLNSSMLPKYWSSPSSFRPMVTGLVLVIDPIVMSLVNVAPSDLHPPDSPAYGLFSQFTSPHTLNSTSTFGKHHSSPPAKPSGTVSGFGGGEPQPHRPVLDSARGTAESAREALKDLFSRLDERLSRILMDMNHPAKDPAKICQASADLAPRLSTR